MPVRSLVDAFFDGDESDPWTYVIDLVKDGLATRALLDRRPERGFRLDTGRIEYALPESTAQLARDHPPETVERQFDATATARPELWELIRWEIDRAVAARLDTSMQYNPHVDIFP